jgi:hypothetical protein
MMAVPSSIKKNKLERNKQVRLERGKKKAEAKALRQARKLKKDQEVITGVFIDSDGNVNLGFHNV